MWQTGLGIRPAPVQGTGMMEEGGPVMKRKRGCLAKGILLGVSVVFCLVAAEVALRLLPGAKKYDPGVMDPGLLAYDSVMGWKPVSNWSGKHRHEDFEARYSTNLKGLRGPYHHGGGEPPVVVLGDSFTFGLGVGDDETFVARLNELEGAGTYLNAGVVGFSTDQELLFLERLQEFHDYRQAVLVVYLGNDLIDNSLERPLQAGKPKPRFVADGGGLVLTNTPVPRDPAAIPPAPSMAGIVLGGGRGHGLLHRSAVFRKAVDFREAGRTVEWSPATGEHFELFTKIVGRLTERLDPGWRLPMVLVPGRSPVAEPGSLSAKYQDFVRGQILGHDWGGKVRVIDVAAPLKEAAAAGKVLYFPNEGHLNAAGHRLVAEELHRAGVSGK
jgi:lysophospholipase L1-like esterase